MGTNITSKNQSGGITGQNVAVTGGVESARAESQPSTSGVSFRKVAGWSVGLVGLVASVFGILEYVGIKLWR